MKGKLNLFQATMLRWRTMHPYNAVHVVRVDAPLDAPRLAATIDTVWQARGLTGLVLDVASGRYEYRGGECRTTLRVVAGATDPDAVLRAEMEWELNAPFAPDGPIDPFRFFVVDAGPWFQFGLAYDHVIAGGDSIAGLLAELVERYSGGEFAPAPPPDLYPVTCAWLLRREAVRLLLGFLAVPRMIASARRSMRPRYPRGNDPAVALASLRIGSEGVAAMARATREWGVTRNDLMMSLVLAAVAPLAGEARHRERRKELGVASIVNLRRDFGVGIRVAFGQFLSSFRYSHPVPAGIDMRTLARALHTESDRVRRRKLYLQTLFGLAGVGFVWPRLSQPRRAGIHAKNYPVWAGVTPLDVDRLWLESGGRTPPREYMRAVSTGPTTPLIVSATTARGVLHIGLSYRTSAFCGEDIARIASGIKDGVERLDAWTGSASAIR